MRLFKVPERGQALAETAMFAVLVAIMGFGILALIPFHRARTAATAAAYGCAQFISQQPLNQHLATTAANRVANNTLNAIWSGTFGTQYKISASPPGGPGQPGRCTVSWYTPVLFNGLLELQDGGWNTVTFVSALKNGRHHGRNESNQPKTQKGQSIVFFALMLPLMAVFLLGILDYMVTSARVMQGMALADLAADAGVQEIKVQPSGAIIPDAAAPIFATEYFGYAAPKYFRLDGMGRFVVRLGACLRLWAVRGPAHLRDVLAAGGLAPGGNMAFPKIRRHRYFLHVSQPRRRDPNRFIPPVLPGAGVFHRHAGRLRLHPPDPGDHDPALFGTPVITFFAYALILDFADYWRHRLSHSFRAWYALHALHHAQRQMSFWSDDRNHIFDDLISFLWFFMKGGIGIPPPAIPVADPAAQIHESLSHANVKLDFGMIGERLLISPRFHRRHHAIAAAGRRSCNYGAVFPYWEYCSAPPILPAYPPPAT